MHPRSGGPPAVVAGSARGLRKRGHDVTVLTTVRPGEEPEVVETWKAMVEDGVRLVFCGPQGLGALLGRSADEALIAGEVEAADVVHLHGVWNPVLLVAGRFARRTGTRYVVSVHGVLDHRALRRILPKWIKKRVAIELFDIRGFLTGAAAVIFGSQAEIDQSWLPAPDMRIRQIPNGAARELGTVPPSPERLEELHEIVPAFGRWSRVLLCRSRIHEEKGLDMLVQAFNEVAGEFPDAGLLIAGMKQDLAFQAKVERLMAAGPAPDRMALTTALTGPRSQFLYLACDIFLLPSIAEGFSMALIEALASGRPVLITRYCHMPVVEAEGAGFVVDPTPSALAAGLRKLLSMSDEELEVLGRNARQLFEQNYTWERISELLEMAYRDSTDGRLSGAA